MAYGRLISRSLGSSRKYHALLEAGGPLGEFCQVLFPLLVANTDDCGRFSGDAFTVKHAVLPTSPRPEADFEQALAALAQVQLIQLYQVDIHRYLQVLNFQSHQLLRRQPVARFPDASGQFGPTVGKLPTDGPNWPLRKEGRKEVKEVKEARVRARGVFHEKTDEEKAEQLEKLKAWNKAHPEAGGKADADSPRRRDH